MTIMEGQGWQLVARHDGTDGTAQLLWRRGGDHPAGLDQVQTVAAASTSPKEVTSPRAQPAQPEPRPPTTQPSYVQPRNASSAADLVAWLALGCLVAGGIILAINYAAWLLDEIAVPPEELAPGVPYMGPDFRFSPPIPVPVGIAFCVVGVMLGGLLALLDRQAARPGSPGVPSSQRMKLGSGPVAPRSGTKGEAEPSSAQAAGTMLGFAREQRAEVYGVVGVIGTLLSLLQLVAF
jgi:hypothetical protein